MRMSPNAYYLAKGESDVTNVRLKKKVICVVSNIKLIRKSHLICSVPNIKPKKEQDVPIIRLRKDYVDIRSV